MDEIKQYFKIMRWANRRYATQYGHVPMHNTDGTLSPFAKIYYMAQRKLLRLI